MLPVHEQDSTQPIEALNLRHNSTLMPHNNKATLPTDSIARLSGSAILLASFGLYALYKTACYGMAASSQSIHISPDQNLSRTTTQDTKALFVHMKSDHYSRLRLYNPTAVDGWKHQPTKLQKYLEARCANVEGHHEFTANELHRPVGIISIIRPHSAKDANLSYWFSTKRKPHTGLATLAVRESISKVFKDDQQIQRIFALAHKTNISSNRLIEMIKLRKASSSEISTCTARKIQHEHFHSHNIYVITRAEWPMKHLFDAHC